ncbi:type 1 glutamine amidotransferase-like domain-containing protein [bacterium]|nr:type 1 glutamine amidotransferase-like domain-containing protein [bacterium]
MKLILNGGGCGDKTQNIYAILNSMIDNTKPILCIPLAREKDESGYENSKKWLSAEIANINCTELVMADSAEHLAGLNLSDFGMIYISGGNTYKLLRDLKSTQSLHHINEYLQKGGVVYGSSAGAIIFGQTIKTSSDRNVVELLELDGYNLVGGFSIAAHYTNKNEENTKLYTKHLTELSKTYPVIALPEEDSIIIDGDRVRIVGERDYYVFKKGQHTQHSTSNADLELNNL